jgi:hypothetical protein
VILPDKHITLPYSLLSGGAIILSQLGTGLSLFDLREKTKNNEPLRCYEKFIWALDFLYLLGAIEFRAGKIARLQNA